MASTYYHISVCICTYKRPEMLSSLLVTLENQKTEGLFEYSVVIVDNDQSQSARSVVESRIRESKLSMSYDVEPEQNIALARNKAIQNAKGNWIALIDDDEFPIERWLLNLYKAMLSFHADGVLGPVKPHFKTAPPGWIVRGKFCERDSFQTGTVLRNPKYTRTGNVLLRREVLDDELPFNPLYGKTGGEDIDFFSRRIRKGNRFVWCNEAWVYEIVPPGRLKRSYFLKRALLRGVANSKRASWLSLDVWKSILAFVLYTPAVLLLVFLRHDLFMRYLIKDCDHLGKLLALCGFNLLNERSF